MAFIKVGSKTHKSKDAGSKLNFSTYFESFLFSLLHFTSILSLFVDHPGDQQLFLFIYTQVWIQLCLCY